MNPRAPRGRIRGMPIHVLRSTQVVPASLEDCWAFFSDPHQLSQITPQELDFQVCGDLPAAIHPGLMIEYRVRPLFGIPVTWLTEITYVEPLRRFVDEQRVGPYALWHHEHIFTALPSGGTEIRDTVHYVLPFGWLGDLVHPFLVVPQLKKIFDYREEKVRARFGN